MKNLPLNMQYLLVREPFWADFLSGICCIGWSVISMFSSEPLVDREAYWQLAEIARYSVVWEIMGITCGAIQIASVLSNSLKYRKIMLGVTSWWWLFLGIGITLNDHGAPSLVFYYCFGLFNLFILFRLARRYA
jgi:hypothetical protein